MFKYGMRLRGYSIGCQPRGVVKWEDADKDKDEYWSFIWYDEKLTTEQEDDYELDFLGEE